MAKTGVPAVHPAGEQPTVELAADGPMTADTFAGRVHLEWEPAAPVTTIGQLAFFIGCLKQGGLFEGWVAGCPLHLTSPNAPAKRDMLGLCCCRCWPDIGATPTSRRCAATG
jgi:hypothetical protein